MPRRRRALQKSFVFPEIAVNFRRKGVVAPIVFHSPTVKNVEGVDQMYEVYKHFARLKLMETCDWTTKRLSKGRKKRLRTRKKLIARRLCLIATRRRFRSLKLKTYKTIKLTRNEYDFFDRKWLTYHDIEVSKQFRSRLTRYYLPVLNYCYQNFTEIEMLKMFFFFTATVLANTIINTQYGTFNFTSRRSRLMQSITPINEQLPPEVYDGCGQLLLQILFVLRQFERLTDGELYSMWLRKTFRLKNCKYIRWTEKYARLFDDRKTDSFGRKLAHSWKKYAARSFILHGYALEAEKLQKNNQVSVTKKELVRLESVKSESKQKLVEIQNSIEESLEENQKLVLDNVKLELHDRTKDVQKIPRSSYQLNHQRECLRKLKKEKKWWVVSCKRRMNRAKSNVKPISYWSDKVKSRVSQVAKEIPEQCKKKIELALVYLKKLEELKYETAERKQLRTHLTSKLRYTWLEHHENMTTALKEDREAEIEHLTKRQEILSKVKKDRGEARYYYYRSFTIPFSLPKRLQPPFPVSVMDFRPPRPMVPKPVVKPIAPLQQQPPPQKHPSISVPVIKPPVRSEPDAFRRSSDKNNSQQNYETSGRSSQSYRRVEEPSRRRSRSPRRMEKDLDKRRLDKPSSSSTSRYEASSSSRYRDEPSSSRYRENDRDRRRRDEQIDVRRDRYEDERDRNRKRKGEDRNQRPRSRSGDRSERRERKYSDEDLRKKVPSMVVKKRRYDETVTVPSEQRREFAEDSRTSAKVETTEKKISPKDENLREITPVPDETESNLPNSMVFYSFFNQRDMKGNLSQIPTLGLETFVKFMLPINLSRPLNVFPSFFRVTIDQTPREIPEEKYESKILILMVKYFLRYIQNECAIQITSQADVDFLSQEIYPFEIVRQILHNFQSAKNHRKNGESNRNYLPKIYKAKFAVAQGMMNLLKNDVETINTIYEIEDNVLYSIKDQTRVKNAMDYARRHVKLLTKVNTNIRSIINALKTMKHTHETFQQFKNKEKTILNNRSNVLQRKKNILEGAKERIKTENEEKRKKLEALRQQYLDSGEEYRQTCIKHSTTDIELTRKRMVYNIVQEDNKRADSIESRLDIITKEVYKKYKDMLFCSTCKLRKKNCALTKCWHIFCDECVQSLIRTRNRKCPECGARFGLNEFKKVFIE